MIDSHVLVLDQAYLPLQVTTVRHAFALMFRGAAMAVNVNGSDAPLTLEQWLTTPINGHGDIIHTPTRAFLIPRVILLPSCAHKRLPRVRFSRENILKRDAHTCQYCARPMRAESLNIDHVVPRSQGGATNWENVVACCRPCNMRKGGRTPREAGMHLVRPPRTPAWSARFAPARGAAYPAWKPFLEAGGEEPTAGVGGDA